MVFAVGATILLHFLRPFSLEVVSAPDGGLDLRPRGLLWMATNARFARGLIDAIEADGGSGPVRVSLDRSTAIDAATAAALVSGKETAQNAGRTFSVSHVPLGAELVLEGLDVTVVSDQK